MTNVPIFGSLDAVPFRVGKLWFVDNLDLGSPELGMAFNYMTVVADPEMSFDTDPERAAFRDFVLEYASDPAPGFGKIFANNFVHTNGGRPVPSTLENPEMMRIFAEAVDDVAAAEEEMVRTDLKLLKSAVLMLAGDPDEVTWLWAAFRYRNHGEAQGFTSYATSHLAVRADAGHIHLVRFTYPGTLDPGVGFRTFLRYLYEWDISVRQVAAGGHAIHPYSIPDEEEWGDLAIALEHAPVPIELLVPRQGSQLFREPPIRLPRRLLRGHRRLPTSHRRK